MPKLIKKYTQSLMIYFTHFGDNPFKITFLLHPTLRKSFHFRMVMVEKTDKFYSWNRCTWHRDRKFGKGFESICRIKGNLKKIKTILSLDSKDYRLQVVI